MVYIIEEIEKIEKFKPFALVIETKEELATLWRRLNIKDKVFDNCCAKGLDTFSELNTNGTKLFEVINDECIIQKLIDRK